MRKWHIGRWASGVSAKLMRRKPSPLPEAVAGGSQKPGERQEETATPITPTPKSPEEVAAIIKKLAGFVREQRAKAGEELDPRAVARGELAELILPKILSFTLGTDFVKVEAAKAWAFACADMLGMIAGMVVETSAIEPALAEAMKEAVVYAKLVDAQFSRELGRAEAKAARPSKPSDKATPSAASDAQQMHIIKDLESQAEKETDKAVAAAMKAMAAKMRLELKGKEEKVAS